jgi:hypothetical protein
MYQFSSARPGPSSPSLTAGHAAGDAACDLISCIVAACNAQLRRAECPVMHPPRASKVGVTKRP